MVLLKPTLLVLLGVFLVAILLHMFILRKEFFVDIRTPLNKDNVKKAVDDVLIDLLGYYQKLKDSKTNDVRVKYRLIALTELLNGLNDFYPGLEYNNQQFDYSKVPTSVTLSELNVVKDFLTRRVGAVANTNILAPADLTDIDLLSNRLQATFDFIQQRAKLLNMPVPPEVGIQIRTMRENLKKLKLDLPNLKPQDINLLKIDQYIPALFLTSSNFAIPPDTASAPIPTLNISNLPNATTQFKMLAAPVAEIVQPTVTSTPAPPPTPTLAPAPPTMQTQSGLKFSELIQTLLSYSPMAAPGTIAPGLSVSGPLGATPNAKLTSTTADLLATPSDAILTGSNAPNFFDKLRGIVREEVKGQFSNVAYTPKDVQSAKVIDRSTAPVLANTPTVNSDALQQGSWFRQDQGCPYAASQGGGNPMPYPIDMNDYIRKDSIPCYGCTLK
jgi:hypothetical protein